VRGFGVSDTGADATRTRPASMIPRRGGPFIPTRGRADRARKREGTLRAPGRPLPSRDMPPLLRRRAARTPLRGRPAQEHYVCTGWWAGPDGDRGRPSINRPSVRGPQGRRSVLSPRCEVRPRRRTVGTENVCRHRLQHPPTACAPGTAHHGTPRWELQVRRNLVRGQDLLHREVVVVRRSESAILASSRVICGVAMVRIAPSSAAGLYGCSARCRSASSSAT
jgi:hypothetical protein